MTRDKFTEYVQNLSDYDLYILAKENLTTHKSDVALFDWQNEMIYDECQARHPDIYNSALNDAVLMMATRENNISDINISDIIRPSLMSRVELANFIGDKFINNTEQESIAYDSVVKKVLAGSDDNYLFCTVSGNSMTGAEINDNDVLLVEKSYSDLSGKIIVASVNNILFVKRYLEKDGAIWLHSENENYEPFKVGNDVDFKILGVVKMIMHSVD